MPFMVLLARSLPAGCTFLTRNVSGTAFAAVHPPWQLPSCVKCLSRTHAHSRTYTNTNSTMMPQTCLILAVLFRARMPRPRLSRLLCVFAWMSALFGDLSRAVLCCSAPTCWHFPTAFVYRPRAPASLFHAPFACVGFMVLLADGKATYADASWPANIFPFVALPAYFVIPRKCDPAAPGATVYTLHCIHRGIWRCISTFHGF